MSRSLTLNYERNKKTERPHLYLKCNTMNEMIAVSKV